MQRKHQVLEVCPWNINRSAMLVLKSFLYCQKESFVHAIRDVNRMAVYDDENEVSNKSVDSHVIAPE